MKSELVGEYGSPLYVYDLAETAAAVADLRAVLPESAIVYYSVKANANAHVLAELRDAGCAAEVSSTGEVAAVRAAGFDPGECLYTGPGKTGDELDRALADGVRTFSAESLADLGRIAAAGRRAGVVPECLLRVNANSVAGGAGFRMGGHATQFGFPAETVGDWAAAALDVDGVSVAGLHFFPLSNAEDETTLLSEFRQSLATARYLHDVHSIPLRTLDLGGGFAAPYARPGRRPDYTALAGKLGDAVAEFFPASAQRPVLAFESGRYLTATCGTLVARVTETKQTRGVTYAILDTGVNHLGGMSGLRRIRPTAAAPVAMVPGPADTPTTLVGPLCTPADVLARDHPMPVLGAGDLVAFPNVGAYGLSASLIGFLGRDLPTEVAVRGTTVVGASRQAITRQTVPTGPDPRELAAEIAPTLSAGARAADDAATFPVESLTAMRQSGLLGLLVPRESGGLGGDLADLADVVRTLGGACASSALIFLMHSQQVDAIVRHGTDRLRRELLPRIARGELYLASVTSERETGGDLFTCAAPLHHNDERVRLSRGAPIVTGGAYADGFLVTMRADESAPRDAVTLVFAERHQLSIDSTDRWNPLGMRATHSIAMRLDGEVPAHHIVGGPGDFRTVALDSFLPLIHIGWAASWLGTAHQALRDLVSALRSPKRPGGTRLGSDLLHERLARTRHELELVSAYLHRVVTEAGEHRAAGTTAEAGALHQHLTCLKVTSAELTYQAIDRMVQIAGLGLGYQRDSPVPLERHLRDLRSAALNCANDWLLRANGMHTLADRELSLL